MFERTERGQVGIGTLIVFIAMVLVAAIAAGVLVNTAGFLQNKAEETGQQSTGQVTDRLEVVDAHGVADGSGNVKLVNVTVRLAAGSGALDLNNTTVMFMDEGNVAQLTYNDDYRTDPATNLPVGSGTEYAVNNFVKDADGSAPTLNDGDDRFELTIDATLGGTVNGLDEGEQLKLEVTTKSGATTTVILTMPDTLDEKADGEPVKL